MCLALLGYEPSAPCVFFFLLTRFQVHNLFIHHPQLLIVKPVFISDVNIYFHKINIFVKKYVLWFPPTL